MRAEPPFGEWHMHCHWLMHMSDGMMGSLLVVNDGDAGSAAAARSALPARPALPAPARWTFKDDFFTPPSITIPHGTVVRWTNKGGNLFHTVTSNGHRAQPSTAGRPRLKTSLGSTDSQRDLRPHVFQPGNVRLSLRHSRLRNGWNDPCDVIEMCSGNTVIRHRRLCLASAT